MKVYKYFGNDVLEDVVKNPDYFAIKCSLPKEYNDPFELTLGVDLDVSAEFLAAYAELIGELPQRPTTCFSRSPAITPMWAHYGNNHNGFVVEFDTEKIKSELPKVRFGEVEYKDYPNSKIGDYVAHAAVTKKPRYAALLNQLVFSEAYFSKQTIWRYEKEYRLVCSSDETKTINEMEILYLPRACVSAVISGKNAESELISELDNIESNDGISHYRSFVGRSFPSMYFHDKDHRPHVFDDTRIAEASFFCEECYEPVKDELELCPWCKITEADELEAAMSNQLRMFEAAGMLDDYLTKFEK